MKKMLLFFLNVLLFSCSSQSSGTEPTGVPPQQNHLLHAEGQNLANGDGNVIAPLRGIAFGNEVWNNPSLPPETHHRREDYLFLADHGINTVRFYLNYRIFEEDDAPYLYKQSGFDWLDKNIAWAEEAGISLILNMHVPQGGFQSLGEGEGLWENRSNQKRFIALWREIARRYRDEPIIIGYDLLNEPICTKNLSQWEQLAAETVQAVREADPYHLIIIERTNSVKAQWDENANGNMNFFTVDDFNIMYEFHFYKPMTFSHQGAPWVNGYEDLRSVYPDGNVIEGSGIWSWATFDNPVLPTGDTSWIFLEGSVYTHTSADDYDYAVPAVQVQGIGPAGTVRIDDIVITVWDPDGNVSESILLDMDSSGGGWYFWSEDGSGNASVASNGGRSGSGLLVSGAGADSNYSCSEAKILLNEGYSYSISGWAAGERTARDAKVRFRLDFYRADGPVMLRNRAYLEQEIARFKAFGESENVPLYLGEFGLTRYAFEENRGGLEWVRDVVEIAEENGIHHNYHDFHEYYFGLYGNHPTENPADLNTDLAELFKELYVNQ